MKSLLFFFFVSVFVSPSWCDEPQCENEDEPCFLEEEKQENKYSAAANYPHFEKLSKLEGVKVGHVQEYEIDGVKLRLETKAMKPLLFQLDNAITDAEIEHVVALASNNYRSGGMVESVAKGGLTPEDPFRPSTYRGRAEGPAQYFTNWDMDDDEKIDLKEVGLFCRNFNFLYFDEDDVKLMIKKVYLPEFDDGVCTLEEFGTLNTYGVENYLNILMREHPKWRQRSSEQTWLPLAEIFDPVLSKMRQRFGKLLKMPFRILEGSEHLQVVKYKPGGHYHAHHDSETEKATDKRCCHHTSTKTVLGYNQCRLCRFITVMGYLAEPEEGGETAFLAADNITYSDASFRTRGKVAKDFFNLSHHCQDANLVIKPKKGRVVIWYNHDIDPKSGWMGKLDDWSIHGGCDVKKGHKWIMNMWLTAPYADSVDNMSMYSMEYLENTKDQQM